MKKFLLVLLVLVLILSLNSSINSSAATTTTKLTTREMEIAKAYVKSYESGSLSSVKKYIYSGSKMTVNALSKTTNVKVFSATYSKKYDSKTKMNCIIISCVVTISNGKELNIYNGTMGINLKTKGTTVYAYSKNTTMAKLSKITINYITESQVKEIEIYMKNKYGSSIGSKMIKDNTIGTIDSPVSLGKKYTYSTLYYGEARVLDGTFGITINKVTDLTVNKAKSLGYNGRINEGLEFKLVNITWDVIKVKVRCGGNNKDAYIYKNDITPVFFASVIPNVDFLGGFIIKGFAGSFIDNFKDKYDKIKTDSITSFTVTGNIVIPTIKGGENYITFVIPKKGNLESNKIYFKLK